MSAQFEWCVYLLELVADDVRDHPELYSMIYVPNPFVVPGGRFREFYYWDSYWIIQGLLISEMKDTVQHPSTRVQLQ